jgi:hypothetical protein
MPAARSDTAFTGPESLMKSSFMQVYFQLFRTLNCITALPRKLTAEIHALYETYKQLAMIFFCFLFHKGWVFKVRLASQEWDYEMQNSDKTPKTQIAPKYKSHYWYNRVR